MRPTKRTRRKFVPSLFEQPNLEVRFMPAGLPFVGPISDSGGPQALINQGDLHSILIDRTNEPGAIITARGSNGTGEGAPKAFDNNAATKWLDFSADTWIQYQFHNDLRRYAISQYTITSGDDSPERDPKSWALKGSNDGVNWTTLDTRGGQAFADRGQINTYDFANTTPYAYYKLDNITNNSGSITQIAEIQLKGPQAAIRPAAINVGGGADGGFAGDSGYSGGNVNSVPFQIDTSGVVDPAPQSAYQNERWSHSSFNYSLPNLTPGAAYTVRLHFAELYYNSIGDRKFDVSINGNTVLDDFDILQAAGGTKFKAVAREFTAVADANGVISLDFSNVVNGATVAAIEALPAASITDLARGKATTASSSEGATFGPANAVDGNSASRWSSGQWLQGTSTGWIAVDLGATYNISRVKLNWETAYAANYQIQVSLDGSTWSAIKTVTGNTNPGWFDYTGLSGVGRYVRVYATATSAANNNYSLFDLNVYGS